AAGMPSGFPLCRPADQPQVFCSNPCNPFPLHLQVEMLVVFIAQPVPSGELKIDQVFWLTATAAKKSIFSEQLSRVIWTSPGPLTRISSFLLSVKWPITRTR